MIRANKLNQLKGPHNVGENGKFGGSGDFSEIFPISKVVGEMIRVNKLTQLERPWNVGENGESAKLAILAKFRQGCWWTDKSK